MLHGGSTALSNGAIVGLPITFSYDTVDDFKKEDLLVNLEQFDFQTAVGRDLLNSLILSEKAQKFAIAREIHACRTPYPYVFGSFALLGTLLSYSLASAMNTKFDLFRLPRTIRVIMYVLTSAIGLTTYCMVKDATNYYYDKVADESACEMGKDYILGGIEFYEKIMARNVALRSALGEKGKKLYTSFGNEEVFLRTPKMPLSAHLDLVKEKLKEIENNEVSATPSS